MAFPTDLDDLSTTRAAAGTDKLSTPDHLIHHVAEDAAVESLEDKVGVDDSAVTTSLDYFLRTGWINPGETWTYASASTFTVPGDQTAKYTKGTRLKWTQTTVKYGVVVASAYSDPNTTVTIAVNTDYTIADAAISANFYSYAVNPQGYPHWFNWTPTLTSGADLSAYTSAQFQLIGETCFFNFRAEAKNVTTSGAVNISAPINNLTRSYQISIQVHNGTAWVGHVHCRVESNNIIIYKTESATNWAGTETGVYLRATGFYRIA